jgi:RimJ/RimL family protein N-acetyltransferase
VWGKGYGSEAWIGVCDYLFRQRRVRKITAGTASGNRGMLAIMTRAGMVDDGRRVRQVLIDGQEMDLMYAALFAEAWLHR